MYKIKNFNEWKLYENVKKKKYSILNLLNEIVKDYPQKYKKHSNSNRIFSIISSINEFKSDIEKTLQKRGILYQNVMFIPAKSGNPFTNQILSSKFDSILFKIGDKFFVYTLVVIDKNKPSTKQHETCSIISFEKALKFGNTIVSNFIEELSPIYPGIIKNKSWLNSFQSQTNALIKYLDGVDMSKHTFFRDSEFTYKLYNHAKKLFKFRVKDSWNPADVWIVKNPKIAIKDLLKTNTIEELNNKLKVAILNNEILPISLKKTKGVAKVEGLNLQPFNFKLSKISKVYIDTKYNFSKRKFKSNGATLNLNNESSIAIRSVYSNELYIVFEGANKNSISQLGKVPKNILNSIFPTVKDKQKDWEDLESSRIFLKEMYFKLNKNSLVDLNNSTWEEFISGMEDLYNHNLPRYAEKASSMNYIYELLNKTNLDEVVTNLYYSQQKKGPKFGPFIKIY